MDTELLVGDRIADGRRLLAELSRGGFDVKVAFWVRTGEESLWHLYIASPTVVPANIGAAYGQLYTHLSRVPDLSWGLSEVRLVTPTNPVAAAAIALRDQNPGLLPIRYHGPRLGEVAVEEAYIYPPLPQSRQPVVGEDRRLKKDVKQIEREEDFRLTPEEHRVIVQLVSQGVSGRQAEELVRKKRERLHPRPPIPAGTVVRAWVAAHWGSHPGDDPNPLLMVEAADGARGLTLKDDTEPV
jgi:hypothetical protein